MNIRKALTRLLLLTAVLGMVIVPATAFAGSGSVIWSNKYQNGCSGNYYVPQNSCVTVRPGTCTSWKKPCSGSVNQNNSQAANNNSNTAGSASNNQTNAGNAAADPNGSGSINQGNANTGTGSSNIGSNTTIAGGYTVQVADIVNQERAAQGMSSLTYNSDLAQVAQMKAEDMAKNNYFSHTSPTYGSAFDMLYRAGISYRSSGENIAKGQSSPAAVMKAWMNSSGHRANILGSSYSEIGVGYAVASNGTKYWVQIFKG